MPAKHCPNGGIKEHERPVSVTVWRFIGEKAYALLRTPQVRGGPVLL